MSATLTLAALLQLATACAPGSDPNRLADYSAVESSGDTLALNLNGPGGGALHPATLDEAITLATRLIAAGRSVDIGVMQLNSAHLGEPGMPRTVAEAFEPCRNIAAGAAVLAAADRAAACLYNTGRAICANGYPERIQAATAQRLQGGAAPSTSASVAARSPASAPQADPDAPPRWAVFAVRRPHSTEAAGEREAAPAVTVTASRREDIAR